MAADLVCVTTLGDLLVRAAERWPEREALVFPDSRATYRALLDASMGRARSLAALGVSRGERVGILMPNCPEFVELLFGIALLGAISVPVNARYKAAELAYVIENADLVALLTTDRVSEYVDFAKLLAEALPMRSAAPKLRARVLLGASTPPGFLGRDAFDALVQSLPASEIEVRRARVRVRDPALMMYTSGTTANPKGCTLSHEALVRNGIAMAEQRYRLGPEDRFWNPLPMFHMGAVLPLTAVFASGGALVASTHFSPGPALEQMQRERATVLYPSFPTLTLDLIEHPRFETTDLSRVRIVNNVAPPETLRRMQAAFPQAVQVSAYGLTEAGGVISYGELDDDLETRLHTCGRPFRGIEVRVVDPQTGRELAAGEPGEILVRGYVLTEGYYKDPEKTAATLDGDGWLHTGDLCSVDPNGRIAYHGRIKDMLKVGGENVAAVEIESFLGTHPAVLLAQVVGVPDERFVEVPAAFVELRKGKELSAEALLEFCRGRIASFKIPRHVRFVSSWPMSATKIQKFRLREDLVRDLGRG